MNKKQELKNQLEDFVKSTKTAQDYINLFVIVKQVLSQGSGLLWSDVDEVINEVVNNNEQETV